MSNKITETTQKIPNIQETIAPQSTKTLDAGLPDRYLIKTSFIPQAPEKNWNQPWQDACEEAALLTIDYYYRHLTPSTPELLNSYSKMFDFESSKGWSHDINLEQMSVVGSEYLGYKPAVIKDPSMANIKKYISENVPVIIPANGKILFQENKYFKSGGPYYHNLVILGYDDNSQKFTVHDVGTQFGTYFKYTYKTLMDSIHDFPVSGNKEDISSGDKKILVLIK